MSLGQAGNSLSLFGQQPLPVAPAPAPSIGGPQLAVPWGSFHQGFGSSLYALFAGPSAPKKFLSGEFFRDCWIEGRVPRSAVFAAALWHVAFLLIPWPELPAHPRRNPALENFQLTWSGPINDLPPLQISAPAVTPSPRGDQAKPLAIAGADAFHPRQRIFTDPAHPTHPRQTLINSTAPAVPPKILPSMPNIVLLQQTAGPAKPRVEISEQMLAQLHPRERRAAAPKITPAPDVAPAEGAPAEITLAPSSNAPARPKLELNAGVAPRVAQQRAQSGNAGPAPELAHQNSSSANESTFIALSATPGPVAPAAPPQGNLAARVAISPEGKQPGTVGGNPSAAPNNGGSAGSSDSRGGTPTGAGGKNSTAISISGGNPVPKNISGLGGNPQPKTDSTTLRGLSTKIDPRAESLTLPNELARQILPRCPPAQSPNKSSPRKRSTPCSSTCPT